MAKTAVGVEINQDEVIAVRLRQGRRGPSVKGHARERLVTGAVTTTRVAQPDELRRAVQTVLRRVRARRASVCLSLFTDVMDARVVRYPALPKRELLENIQWDLQDLLGASEDGSAERLVDVAELPSHAQAENGVPTADGVPVADNQQPYLAVSAPKHTVYEYVTPLQEARIFPKIVDLGAFSLPWAVPGEGSSGFLHLGPELTHFVIWDNGVFELQRQSDLTLGRVLPTGTIVSLLDWLDETLDFVREGRGLFMAEDRLQRLVVSGVGATARGLLSLIGERTGLHVVDAVPTILAEGEKTISRAEAPIYALAVALAQRGLSEL